MKTINYNKLIRDKIPEIIKASNKTPIVETASGEELLNLLNLKLQEELDEYNSSGEVEELADLVEVVQAILDLNNVSLEEFEKIRIDKSNNRGAFKEGLVLIKVIED